MKNLTEILPNLFVVEVPIDVDTFHIGIIDNQVLGLTASYGFWESDLFLNENFSVLGTVTEKEISFDVEPYVYVKYKVRGVDFYVDYEHETNFLDTAKESFYSALPNKGFHFVNPMGEEPSKPKKHRHSCYWNSYSEDYSDYIELHDKWENLESSLVKKLLILKKE